MKKRSKTKISEIKSWLLKNDHWRKSSQKEACCYMEDLKKLALLAQQEGLYSKKSRISDIQYGLFSQINKITLEEGY